MINGLLALVGLVAAIFCFYKFQTGAGETMWAIAGVVAAIVMVVFGVMFLTGRVNKTEDIHITE
jgi:4-amino-4-deoxy-L-arabinose transferase-like glycosyltransferase